MAVEVACLYFDQAYLQLGPRPEAFCHRMVSALVPSLFVSQYPKKKEHFYSMGTNGLLL